MAGLGKKTFSDGEVLSAADVNGYLMDQSVMRFADSTARTAAIGTPTEGMVTYLDDVNQIEVYDGTAWVDQQAPILSEGTAGQYLQSNGTAGSQWVTLEIAENIITTQGDLIVGAADNTPERLGIGAADTVLTSDGTAVTWAAAGGGGGFNTVTEVTASNASYDVSGISGIAKITVIGAGGGAGYSPAGNGTDGGNSSVTYGGTTVTANGGDGGEDSYDNPTLPFRFSSANGARTRGNDGTSHQAGTGGEIKIAYADLTSLSTINIVIGAKGTGTSSPDGNDGIVILEYTV